MVIIVVWLLSSNEVINAQTDTQYLTAEMSSFPVATEMKYTKSNFDEIIGSP